MACVTVLSGHLSPSPEIVTIASFQVRVFTAALATETNTFSPIAVDRRAFEASLCARPGEHPATPTLCTAPITVGREVCAQQGWTLIEGSASWADPAGLVARTTHEELRDEILAQLQAAMPVDAVVLGLHGAMVAQGYDDPEGDLLSRIRTIVGPGVFAGILAIGLRSIGFCAKLLYEAIEEIDESQVEAVRATGASGAQVTAYGVVPQVLPAFAGISVFRWDINIRESTVLGLVGAGGIGLPLNAAITTLAWTQVSLILLVIIGTVVVSEWVSAKVRHAII